MGLTSPLASIWRSCAYLFSECFQEFVVGDLDFVFIVRRWDVIIETAGGRPISQLRQALTPRGTLVVVGGEGGGKWVGKAGRMVWAPALSLFVSHKLTTLAVKHNGADLVVLKDLIEAGKVMPVIGKTYQLHEVPQAIRDLEQRRTRGKSIVRVSDKASGLA